MGLPQEQHDDASPPATSPDHEIVGTAGRDRAGRAVFLARELATSVDQQARASEQLVVVYAPTTETSAPPSALVRTLAPHGTVHQTVCYVCGAPRADEIRFCEACGAAMSVAVPLAAGQHSAAARLEAVKAALGGQLVVIGEIPASGGDAVYFAREPHPDGVLLALVPRDADADADATRAGTTPLVLDAMPAIDAIQPSLPPLRKPAAEEGAHGPPTVHATPPETVAAVEDPLVGGLLDGKYRVLRLLGQGGMGRVFDARHEQLRARRAIKVMHPFLQSRADLVTRFYEEARNAERVKHEHVCTVHDFGSSNGLIYIAMEFVDGDALSAVLKREGRLAPARVATIVAQTADALDTAHALRIIHRDVKPDNIMLCRRDDGRDDVKVVDFGISKALNRSELTGGGTDTQLGVVIGTLDYMSHEQRNGLEIDKRTDVYALARTAVKMLFGELPEHGEWREWSRTRVEPALAAVLSRGLAAHDERYASAGEFARDLTRVLSVAPPDPRTRMRLVLSAVGALALVIALAVGLWPKPPDPDDDRTRPDTGRGGPPPGPTALVIEATPAAVRFELENGAVVPARHEVRIAARGGSAGDLGEPQVQYDGAATGWLGRPVWRDGVATAPATLVLVPRAGTTPPGTYTARVRVASPDSPGATASIAATLVVKGVAPCAASGAQLARIRRLTDPETGTAADARRVVALVPSLVPSLCTGDERVEAQFRLAEAYLTLSQPERACAVLRTIQGDAASTPLARNVDAFLARCR